MKAFELMQLAAMEQERGQFDEAKSLFSTWLDAHGDELQAATVYFHYALLLKSLNDVKGCTEAYAKALAVNPLIYQAGVNLGLMIEATGDLQQALAVWRKTWRDDLPAEGRCMLLNHEGRLLEQLKQLPQAEDAYCRSLQIHPQQPDVYQHFVGVRRRQCAWPVTHAWLEERLPNHDIQLDVGPFMGLAELDTPDRQRLAAERFIQRKLPNHIVALPKAPQWAHNKLRIGYFSGDFKHHAVSILMAEVFELHDRSRVEIYGFDYSDTNPSAMRQRVLKAFDHHVPLHALTDLQVAERIRELEIDVLIDLTGLTAGSRFGVMAYRPAPVQASYLGYMGSSGVPGIDYILADRFLMPPELAPHFSEKPIYLNSYQANDRQRIIGKAPTRTECGLPEGAFVFCAFNNNYKFTAEVWARWMRILRRTPGSVMWVLEDNPYARQNLTAHALAQGVSPDRLIFAGRVAPEQYLARYQCANLFLDTSPYGAGTTASDALWAGLPVLTCPGATMVSRMAGSLLHAVGLPELIAESAQAYEDLAVALATAPKRLEGIQSRLKAQRQTCALFDTPKFVQNLEDALLEVVREKSGFAITTPMKGHSVPMRIFSIACSDKTLTMAKASGFEVLNNCESSRPDWHEYWPIRQFLLNQTLDERTYYGFFSSQFQKKTQLAAGEVFDFVNSSAAKGADVILFSPQPDQGAGFLNVFEQQEVYSPGFTATSESFVREMGLTVDLRNLVMDSGNIVFSHYFVARPTFWREWLTWSERLFCLSESVSSTLGADLRRTTNGPGSTQVKVFLMERLASLLLVLYPHRFKTSAANPWTMGWSMTKFRDFPQEMVICDALKIAMQKNDFPEYKAAYAAIQQKIKKG
jgi:predicted O-linked N-acetylglucosamine transferase (SPINDLY family)